MVKVYKPRVFLLYWFCIQPKEVDAFQAWAWERGMNFWEQQAGIIQYRTFRQQVELQFQEYLAGVRAKIHGLSQVEAEDTDALRSVLSTTEFWTIQCEFLKFIEPGSLKYVVLDCTYDSTAVLPEAIHRHVSND